MRQCRAHGTVLPDGLRVGHHWIVTEVVSGGRTYYYGECKYCDRTRRFAESPQWYISETARYTLRYAVPASTWLQPVKVQVPVRPVSNGGIQQSFSC